MGSNLTHSHLLTFSVKLQISGCYRPNSLNLLTLFCLFSSNSLLVPHSFSISLLRSAPVPWVLFHPPSIPLNPILFSSISLGRTCGDIRLILRQRIDDLSTPSLPFNPILFSSSSLGSTPPPSLPPLPATRTKNSQTVR